MFFLLPAIASFASAGAGLVGAAATTVAAAATSGGVGTLAAAVGAGFDREAVRRELEAAYAKGYEEAQRVVMDELKAMEYERGRRSAQSL